MSQSERAEWIDLFDRTYACLFARGYQAADIADTLGVSVSTFSHLRPNLSARSFSQRQAAEKLLIRFLALAERHLRTPKLVDTTATARHTLGRHLRAVLQREKK
jgi:hypothetical protein